MTLLTFFRINLILLIKLGSTLNLLTCVLRTRLIFQTFYDHLSGLPAPLKLLIMAYTPYDEKKKEKMFRLEMNREFSLLNKCLNTQQVYRINGFLK